MADNVAVTAGSGTLIATDDDGTAHHQYVKLEFGADNTQTKVTATAGLPVTGDGTDLKITLDGEAVVLGAGSAAIGKLAANSGVDIGDVDILSLPSSLVLGTQADDVANTSDGLQTTAFGYWFDGTTWDRARGDSTDGLLVNLGGNNDVVVSQGTASNLNATVVGTGTFAVQASLSAAIPAGTNNIGDVDVLTIAAGDNNIGNVDIVTVPADPFGTDADAASATGSISAKLRFIASTGIPITGTVTVGSHAVTNAGTFAVQESGSALTALQLIDDAIYVDDADWTDSTSKHVLVGGLYQSTPQTITDGDVGPLSLTSDGAVRIHDGGNTITVDGTVTANLGATDNAVLDAIQAAVEIMDDWDETNRAAVNLIASQAGITGGAGAVAANTPRVTHASDDPVTTSVQIMDDWDSSDACKTVTQFATCTTSVTRPADTTAYAANDALSDSTSAPTSGGFTFTSAARASGGSGIITDLIVVSSNDPATLLQGELWIYDSATTNINDNSAFASSDSDTLLLVGVIPFSMLSTVAGSGTTSYAHVQGLSIGFTCSGSANLRFLVKVKNAYTPASAEVLSFRLKVLQVT